MCGRYADLFSDIWDRKDQCLYNSNPHFSCLRVMDGHYLETFTCTICFANTMNSILLNEGLKVEVVFQCLFLDLWVTLAQLLVVYKAIFKLVHLIVT